MHNVTIIYTRQGPKFLDSSRADHTIDYATCGELTFEKIQQCATSNIKMLVGGKHIVQHGAANCVYNHHGEMLKRKMTKKITVKTKKEPDGEYAVYRADDTESDGSDDDQYRVDGYESDSE